MIIGTCPYDDCRELFLLPIVNDRKIERHTCFVCQRIVWTQHSRIEAWSMTDEDFQSEYDVNAETKTITEREER